MSKPTSKMPANNRRERPTLRTVAQACGLAVTTVSRALNNRSDIALATRQRVRQVADELGYVPDRAGRGLRTGRTHTLSLVLPPQGEITGYTASIISGLGDICRHNGYELSATPDIPDEDELTVVRSIVENRRADGIVLPRTSPQDLRVRYLLENNFPFVTHGRTELATPHASIDFDNECFAELAATRLIQRGRSRLLLIGAPADLTYQTHLLNGFTRVVTRNALQAVQLSQVLDLETSLNSLRQQIMTLFSSGDYPDGIVCAGETAAIATLAGISDAGLTPGQDVDVVAKQTSATLDHIQPCIDSFYEDIGLTGRRLGETLIQLINGEENPSELSFLIQPEARFRQADPANTSH